MAKGYTKKNTPRQPRSSHRGRIMKHSPFGRILMTITRDLPDGSSIEVQHHATKGIRVYHNRKTTSSPGMVGS